MLKGCWNFLGKQVSYFNHLEVSFCITTFYLHATFLLLKKTQLTYVGDFVFL